MTSAGPPIRGSVGIGLRSTLGLLGVAVLLSVAAAFTADGGAVLRGVVGVGAVVAVVLGIHRNRPPAAWAWRLIAVGLSLWVLGDMLWDWLTWRGIDVPANTHWADLLYLSGYVVLGVAFVALVRARSGTRSRDGIMDGSILAVAGVILVWVLLVAPQQAGGTATIDTLILGAYPLADGLLIAAVAWLVLTPGRRCLSMYLLGGALLLVFGADVFWNLGVRFGESWDVWLNPLYPIAYALIGLAVLHPSVIELSTPGPSVEQRIHPARLVFLGIALFVGPLVTLASDGTFGTADLMVTGCSLVVAGFVVARFVSLVQDNERAHAATTASERRFKLLASSAPVGIYEVGPDLRITYANAEGSRLFGRDIVGEKALSLLDQVDPADHDAIIRATNRVLAGEPAVAEFRMHAIDETHRWVSWHGVPVVQGHDGVPLALASTLDITALKEAEAVLARQATHDVLTSLPNRRLLAEQLAGALGRLGPDSGTGTVALMFIDLDRFKLVNDLLGHDAGDSLLVQIGQRIRAALRPHDIVARFGGDEFVALLEHVASRTELTEIAARLIAAVETPVALPDGTIDVGASIGIAIARGPSDDPDALMRDADVAMYRAKSMGRGRYEFFEPRHITDPDDDAAVAGRTSTTERP